MPELFPNEAGEIDLLEVTLGAIAAALIAKLLDRAEDGVVDQGEGIVERLVDLVRGRFSGDRGRDGDEGAMKALERVENAPDSKKRVEELARALDGVADRDPDFRRDLSDLVAAAEGVGVDVRTTTQIAFGDRDPQIADVRDSDVQINYGDNEGAPRVRRISD
jgi:hypothetical protein